MSVSITSGTYPRAPRIRTSPWQHALHTVWRFLEDAGQQRARQHLYQLAAMREASNPELARALRDAARHSGEY